MVLLATGLGEKVLGERAQFYLENWVLPVWERPCLGAAWLGSAAAGSVPLGEGNGELCCCMTDGACWSAGNRLRAGERTCFPVTHCFKKGNKLFKFSESQLFIFEHWRQKSTEF